MRTKPLRSTRLRAFLLGTLVLSQLLFSCKESKPGAREEQITQDSLAETATYQEPYRPQFHFSPKEKWMNDPNGLVYNDGIYHLFYQYYPEDIVWGPMHWGHATSKDLFHWEHQPIALYPDENGYIFSGSAVLDKGNTSGLGTEGIDPLVAIFTYHDPERAKANTMDHQTQGIAYSNDNGKTWNKYENNPVLQNPGKMDFRDPKVFWHEDSNKWVMALAVGDHAEFYSSSDLKNWTFMSEFGKDIGAHGGVWECPDLIKMKVNGTNEEKWVLLISINPGGPNGGSATQYFVGDFDGASFSTTQKEVKWVDHGADNYAGVTYNNAPDGRHVFLGWMSNWNYAQEVPTEKWRSAMSLPRELSLGEDENGYFVSSQVLEAFENLTRTVLSRERLSLGDTISLKGSFDAAEVKWKQNLNQPVEIVFKNEVGEFIRIRLLPENGRIEFDRSKSGKTGFSDSFADKVHTAPFAPRDAVVDVRMILDRASLELFVDEGRYVMTEIFFPGRAYDEMLLYSSANATITDLNINSVSKTWNNE